MTDCGGDTGVGRSRASFAGRRVEETPETPIVAEMSRDVLANDEIYLKEERRSGVRNNDMFKLNVLQPRFLDNSALS